MNLTPLAIALQGIGYGSFLTAVQGLYATDEAPAAPFRGVVITRAYLDRMRARRLALAPKHRAREKTRQEAEDELDETERVQAAQAARRARLIAQAEAEHEVAALMARLAGERTAAELARRRRRRQQQLVAALAH